MKTYLFLLFTLFCFSTSIVSSQTTKSMYGKKFFIAWPLNGGLEDSTFCNFSIHALNKPTSGIIRTPDTTITFTLSEIGGLLTYTSSTPLNGSNYFSKYEVTQSEIIEDKGIYIETNDSVFMYINSVNSKSFGSFDTIPPIENSSESTIIYPINALTTNYFVLTKSEDSAASQFLIVATEDSTSIEIIPSQFTEKGKLAGVPFIINLQKGETYLVRSLYDDLTGSKITSIGVNCKPFAVFVGSPRTTIQSSSVKRYSYLLEQLPPPSSVGNRYVVNDLHTIPMIRILALKDSTLITMNGNYYGSMLSAGQFVDIYSQDIYFFSDKPLLVAQFTTSRQWMPSMVFVASLDHFITKAVFPPHFFSPSISYANLNSSITYTNILIRREDTHKLYINGIKESQIRGNFPWYIIPENPLFCYYRFNSIGKRDDVQTIVECKSCKGFLAINFSPRINSYSMSGVTSFDKYIYGNIDTTRNFSYYSYCQFGESTFEVNADTNATAFYWEFGDGTKSEGKLVNHIFKKSGHHSVKLIVYRKEFCSYDTVRRLINVRPPLEVRAGSRPMITLCKESTAQIGRNIDTNLTYRWSPTIGLSDSNSAETTDSPVQNEVKYYLRGYDQYGCVGIDSIVVRMHKQPIANAGPDTVSCGGNGVQIGRATTGGTPLYSFLWTPADGLSNPNIERPIAAPTITTTYILRVTDINSCVDYDTVTVQALPSPTIDAGIATTICEGDSVQLTATATDNPLFRWVNARNITDSSIGNPYVFPTTTTTYYVAGIFPTGCVAFDSVLVTVTPKPRLPIAFQTTACPTATKTYTVDNRGNITYNWEIVGGNLTNGQGTNEATVVWGAGPTGSIKLTSTTTAGSCSFDTTVTITISSDIKPTITESKKNSIVPSLGTVRFCPNESLTLDIGVGYTEITWTNGSTSRQTTVSTKGWYGVSVKDATGCSGGDSVFVQIVPPPTVFAGNDRVLCGTDTAVMRGNVIGSGTYRYQWIPPTAVSDPKALVTNFIAPTTTNLIFQVIDTANGCITSDTVLMTILSISNDIITTSKPNNILCFGEQMTLDAGAFDSYLWSTGETTRTITINNGGTYWVDAKSGSCSAIDTIQIIQNPQIIVTPTPDITASPGATVTLDANATGGTLPYQFQWTPTVNFVDPSTVQSPRVTASVGSQSYIVTITDANDCVARDTITVFVPSTSTTVTVARREVSASALNVSFPLTLTLEPNTPITPTGFTATLTVPFEQFIPKSVSNGTMTMTQNATDYVVNITVQIEEPLYNNSVITELVGDILLGQQDSTPIQISNAQWQGTTYPVNSVNGTIVLNDVCYSGTRRYLLPTTIGFGIMSINPNPAQHSATFEFGIIEAGQTTFEIIDVFGNVVHSTKWTRQPATPKGGSDDSRTTHTVDVSNLPSGTYYGVLKSFSQRATVPLVITK